MALELPWWARDEVGLPELIAPSRGRLVPPRDAEALAGALVEIADMPAGRANRSGPGRPSIRAGALRPTQGDGKAARFVRETGLTGVRVALLHPSYWPEVRRGGERLVHDVARGMARRGHDVTVLASHRARTRVATEQGVRVVRSYRPPTKPLHRRGYEYHLTNVPTAFARTLAGGYDVAHAFSLADAWAAVHAHTVGGPPVVYSFIGIPTREWSTSARYRLPMALKAVRGSAAVTVLSEAAAAHFRRQLLRDPMVVPGSVSLEEFAVRRPPAAAPTLVCAASLSDPRKQGPLLLRAFEKLRRTRPDARLELVGVSDPHQGGAELNLPAGAVRRELRDDGALARAYAGATASVLASVEEAFGLVVVESFAAGTPVAGVRSGALAELLADQRVGALAEPGDEAGLLAAAMDRALELGEDPATATVCREHAARYDESVVLPRYEALYEGALR